MLLRASKCWRGSSSAPDMLISLTDLTCDIPCCQHSSWTLVPSSILIRHYSFDLGVSTFPCCWFDLAYPFLLTIYFLERFDKTRPCSILKWIESMAGHRSNNSYRRIKDTETVIRSKSNTTEPFSHLFHLNTNPALDVVRPFQMTLEIGWDETE